MNVTVSLGNGVGNPKVVKVAPLPWSQLAAELVNPSRLHHGQLTLDEYLGLKKKDQKRKTAEKDGRWFVLGEFENGLRRAANWLRAGGGTLDHDDGELDEQTIRAALDGLAAIVTTTYGHTPERPRWRIEVQFSRPVTNRSHYARVMAAIAARFPKGVKFDDRSFLPEQLWFVPGCPKDAVQHRRAFVIEGKPFDVSSVPAEGLEPPAAAPAPAREDGKAEERRAEVARLLSKIDLPEACSKAGAGNRELWVRIGTAAKDFEPSAGPEFAAWSVDQPSYAGEADCLAQWASFAKSSSRNPATVKTLQWLAGERTQEKASAEDFPLQGPQTPAVKPETANPAFPRMRRLSEVTIHAGNGNFIDGLCNFGETFQAIGAPGGRKSQGIGWLAYCVATGQSWFNRKTAAGSVLYIAAEREAEQAKRFTVWALADGREPDALPLRLMGPGSTLASLDFARYVAEQAAALGTETGQPCRLIVIDTTMASLPGLDLNKTETATAFGQSLRVIAAKVSSAAVCAVHHTPKSGSETGMGSQGFDAAFEATLLIEATEAGASVRQIKGNTTRDWIEPFQWAGEAVQVEHGGELFLAWRPKDAGAPRAAARRLWKPNSITGRAFTVLHDLSPQNEPVSEAAWKEACAEFLGTGEKLHGRFFDAKAQLRKHGAIVPSGAGHWQRRCE